MNDWTESTRRPSDFTPIYTFLDRSRDFFLPIKLQYSAVLVNIQKTNLVP